MTELTLNERRYNAYLAAMEAQKEVSRLSTIIEGNYNRTKKYNADPEIAAQMEAAQAEYRRLYDLWLNVK